MTKNLKGNSIIKTTLAFFIIAALTTTSLRSQAQIPGAVLPGDSTVVLQYLGSKENFSKMSLRINNPQQNSYRITVADAYKNVLYRETNTLADYDKTLLLPNEEGRLFITVENVQTKIKSVFLANNSYVSYHNVEIKRMH